MPAMVTTHELSLQTTSGGGKCTVSVRSEPHAGVKNSKIAQITPRLAASSLLFNLILNCITA